LFLFLFLVGDKIDIFSLASLDIKFDDCCGVESVGFS
jgi:hypothetical protein